MTVSNDTYKVILEGNGSATSFSFSPMVILEASHLEVTYTDSAGAESILTEGVGTTNYIVVVSSYPGTGSITYPAAGTTKLASGEFLTIRRKLPFEQALDLGNQGGYFPELQEEAFDKALMIDLQQQEEMDRTMKAPVSDSAALDMTLPTSTQRASKFLAFDSSGEPIASSSAISTTPLSSFVETIVDDADAAAVLTTLGITANAQILLGTSTFADMLVSLGGANLTAAENEFTSTDAGAAEGPVLTMFRDSASPAVNDFIGTFKFKGEDSLSNKTTYAEIQGRILDPTDGSEDGRIIFETMESGTLQTQVNIDGTDLRILRADLTVSLGDAVISAGNLDVTAGNITAGGTLTVGGRQVTQLSDKYSEPTFSTGGTTVNLLTGQPNTVRRITLCLNNVSTNGVSDIIMQLGDASSFETSGYSGACSDGGGNDVNSSGFKLARSITAATSLKGTVTLIPVNNSSNVWMVNGQFYNSNGDIVSSIAGTKSLTGTLTRVRLTTEGGVDTFDNGAVSAIVE